MEKSARLVAMHLSGFHPRKGECHDMTNMTGEGGAPSFFYCLS
jgi:hypothetical protein